eukprot:CAMPEP_0194299664 /NCGR_PEP_ID=MMETSP0169-20130528/60837_1 /TAXON_ID=218684 /ORGANISM="Corethron pennatum, Strain L29A3" /LENGTH=177 /DNA_ID=CAMNT_0039049771 /DNA_START=114 /DNA_END=647 /DNA_ORIENTATION=+
MSHLPSNTSVEGGAGGRSIYGGNNSQHGSCVINQAHSSEQGRGGIAYTESYPPPPITPGGTRQPNDLEASAMGVMQRLIQTGELDRLKETLQSSLTSCGWMERMREQARERVRARGIERASVDELASELLPFGNSAVPEIIKADLIREIHRSLTGDQPDGTGRGLDLMSPGVTHQSP